MTRLEITRSAKADVSDTIDFLEREAGRVTAARYSGRFQEAIDRLIVFPESGAPRPALGEFTRMVVIYPYMVLYDYRPADD